MYKSYKEKYVATNSNMISILEMLILYEGSGGNPQ